MLMLDAALQAVHVEGVAATSVFGDSFTTWLDDRGISRATAYRHRQRIIAEGRWEPRSHRPATSPGASPLWVEVEIVRARLALGFDNGADSIRYRLETVAADQDWRSEGWPIPARATINRILGRYDLLVRTPRKRPRSSYRRFVYARPRDCYQIDATEVRLVVGKAVVFEVLDDCSRTLVATHAATAETASDAITAIEAAFTRFGVPALVLSDNGTAFTSRRTRGGTSRFTRTVTDAGARLIHSSPYHPQTCGKVERHHQTFKKWLATHPVPATLAELQHRCDTYQRWYNEHRRHSAHATTPRHAWDHAPSLGGPSRLPAQTDATVATRITTVTGVVTVGTLNVSVGRHLAGTRITILRDGDHITVYGPDGTTLGHKHLDPTKRYQGQLDLAA